MAGRSHLESHMSAPTDTATTANTAGASTSTAPRFAARLVRNRRSSSPTIRRTNCPCCGADSKAWRPIRYGMVAMSVYAQAHRGEVVIGPVNHGRNEPQWACGTCKTRFGRAREDLDRFGRPISDSAPVAMARPSRRRLSGRKIHRVETLEPAALRDLAA